MPNETVVFVDPGDRVTVKARPAPTRRNFDAQAHQEGLDEYRQFVETHFEQIGFLLGGQPEDKIKFLMDTARALPDVIASLKQTGMRPAEIVSYTATVLKGSERWSQPDEIAGDMAEALVRLLKEVAEGLPKK